MKSFFHFAVRLTWSKIVALVILIEAFSLDLMYDLTGSTYRFALPFVVLLITGKWINDTLRGADVEEKEYLKMVPKGSFFHFAVKLSWSKLIALVALIFALCLDVITESTGTNFMYTLPFAVFLITGKQVNEMIKTKKNK